jgi:hypothetical protein
MRPRVAALLLVASLGCAHAPSRTRASARLDTLTVRSASRGELLLVARYRIDGLPYDAWKGQSAELTLSLDDVPFAAVVAQPQVLPGDVVEVPVGLAFARTPREVAPAWALGTPVRVRLRGALTLAAGEARARIPTDVEAKLVLPADALPAPRGG